MSRARHRTAAEADVVLVSMPFGNFLSPSMGLSLLKGALNRAGVASAVRYFSISFARRLGQTRYTRIAMSRRPSVRELAGEWMFARALFGPDAVEDERYVTDILRRRSGWVIEDVEPVHPAMIKSLMAAREHVEPFLDECVDEVLRQKPRLVGFTSVFRQHVASLALAKRIKAAAPDVTVVFGGASCEGAMGAETVRQFPFVDAAVSGEGDLVIQEIVGRVLNGRSLTGVPGVRTQDTVRREFLLGRFDNTPSVRDMDALPYPDFDDFFDEFNRTGFRRAWQPRISFESSRGCWWGEKKHCTFCALNGQTMEFRSKTADRALEELTFLVGRHPGCDVEVVDNILDMRYFQDFLPALAERKLGVELFYETKSNLKKEQLRLLRAAGVRKIQPGIESFSDQILGMMQKGVSGLQNIQLLKWCKELDVHPYWNILWGFPGEPPDEYARMAALVPLLTHLAAPVRFDGLRLDRFSPNFIDAPHRGFREVRPLEAYGYVYRVPAAAVANLAYHFTFAQGEDHRVDEYVAPLLRGLRAWSATEGESAVFYADLESALVVCDTRPMATSPITVLMDLDRRLYLECDGTTDVRRLVGVTRTVCGAALSVEAVVQRLEPLVQSGLLLKDGTRYLALAIPLGEYAPPRQAVRRFYAALARIGRRHRLGVSVRLDPGPGTQVRQAVASRPRSASGRARVRSRSLSAGQFALRGPHELLVRYHRRVS
jgi:ribosomal peptide maturation radical SAM protein 1